MMNQQNIQEDLLLKHYHNLRILSVKQLAAIKEEKLSVVTDFIGQKEMLINEIKKWYEHYEISDCKPDVAYQLREIILEISGYEETGRNLLTEQKEQMRKVLVVRQKSKIIQQAYESQLFPQQLNLQK
jgi:hypothetical protein